MGEKAHGAAVRLHDVRGERSNVPREALLFTKRGFILLHLNRSRTE